MKKCSICDATFKPIGNTRTCGLKCSSILKRNTDARQTIKKCVICSDDFIALGRSMTCSKVCSIKRVSTRVSNRYKGDINFKLADILRSRLNKAIKNGQKTGSAVDDLGCSIEEFKMYIEAQWQEGMSWDNHGFRGWHIDHIKPLKKFNLENREEFLEAAHYTNMQPLWWRENIVKRDKYEQ